MKKVIVLLALFTVAGLALGACTTVPPSAAPAGTAATQIPVQAAAQPTEQPANAASPTQAASAAVGPTSAVRGTTPAGAASVAGVPVAKTLRLPDLQGRKIEAVTGNDFMPLNFVDPATGKAVGWEYEAINEICRRLNCTVHWNVAAWDTMIAAVHDGQFDVGAEGITINDERKQQVDFSIPYMTAQQFMLVRADETRFKTPEEFAADPKLLIGSQAGTTNFYAAVYNVLDGKEDNPRIKNFENFGAAVQALLAGDVDMVLMDAASSRGYVGANPDQLKIIGDPITSEDYGFIFKPQSDLVAPFNAAIAQMKADGFLDYLNNRWFFLYDPTSK